MDKKIYNRATVPYLPHGHFQKGHKSWNQGTKGLTSFKKGNLPKNHTAVGSIKIRKRKNRPDPPIVWIKIAEPNKWKELRRYNWELHFGPIPAGLIVTCKDGDTLNCAPDNLKLITRAQNALRNHNRNKAAESMKKYWAQRRLNKSLNQNSQQ